MELDTYASRLKEGKIKPFSWMGLIYEDVFDDNKIASFGRLRYFSHRTEYSTAWGDIKTLEPQSHTLFNFFEGVSADYIFGSDEVKIPSEKWMFGGRIRDGQVFNRYKDFATAVRVTKPAERETNNLKHFLELSRLLFQKPDVRRLSQNI
jgi:hypothetical protein